MDDKTLETQPKTKKAKRFCIIPFFLSLIAVIAAAYSVFQNNLFINKLATVDKYSHKDYMRFVDLKSKLAILSESQAGVQTQITDLVHRIDVTNSFHANTDLITKHALQTLELANIEANWGKNLSASLVLLNRAEKILQTLQKDSIKPVIDSIHNAADQVKSYINPDMASTLETLNQMQNEAFVIQEKLQAPAKIETDNAKNSTSMAQESANLLKKLVVVKFNEHNNNFNSSLNQKILINKLILDLQAANLGLIQNNHKIYIDSLNQALQHSQMAFSKDPNQLQHFSSMIQQLELYKLIDQLPSFNETISLLKAWVAKNENAVPANQIEPIHDNKDLLSPINNTNQEPKS